MSVIKRQIQFLGHMSNTVTNEQRRGLLIGCAKWFCFYVRFGFWSVCINRGYGLVRTQKIRIVLIVTQITLSYIRELCKLYDPAKNARYMLHLSLQFDGIISRCHYELQSSLNMFSAPRQEAGGTTTQMTVEK